METVYCFKTLCSFKIFRMIKQIIAISNATIQYGSRVKTRASSKSRASYLQKWIQVFASELLFDESGSKTEEQPFSRK